MNKNYLHHQLRSMEYQSKTLSTKKQKKPEEEYGLSKKLAEDVLKFSEQGNHVEILDLVL